jgi:hypothetical protein
MKDDFFFKWLLLRKIKRKKDDCFSPTKPFHQKRCCVVFYLLVESWRLPRLVITIVSRAKKGRFSIFLTRIYPFLELMHCCLSCFIQTKRISMSLWSSSLSHHHHSNRPLRRLRLFPFPRAWTLLAVQSVPFFSPFLYGRDKHFTCFNRPFAAPVPR